MNSQEERVEGIYISDAGDLYRVTMSLSHAFAGGFYPAIITTDIPKKPKLLKMRSIAIENANDGSYLILPIAQPWNSAYLLGGDSGFVINGKTGWRVTDRFREKP